MKKKLLPIVLLFVALSNAQETQFNLISLTANLNYPIALGDNFLSKAYTNNAGFDIALQINATKHLFFGIMGKDTNEAISNKELIGDFGASKSTSQYFYVGYRHNLRYQKLYLEHFIGFGNKEITNTEGLAAYNIKGDKSYLVGSRCNYKIGQEIDVYAGFDFNYTMYPIKLVGPYQKFYSESYQISPIFGLKLSFWKIGKKTTTELKKPEIVE